jgi:protein-disulfide isomerase
MKMFTSIFKFILLALTSFLVLPVMTDSMSDDKNYNYLGDKNAPNILVEYASLSCVHCANFHNKELPAIKSQLIDKGKLKYIYKDFPLDLPAMLAAMVSNCYSGPQYFEILKSLFRNQKKWVVYSNDKKQLYSSFYSVLKEHGISLKKINSCTEETEDNKQKWDNILATRLDAQKKGVNSTPTFFLNGKKLEGLVNLEKIEQYIY